MILRTLLAAALGAAFSVAAQAQAWPSKPIRLVVPYVAGGSADITARVVADKLGEALGVAVVVDNKPGGNGGIGTDAVAKAAPDGYTLLMDASGPLVVNPSLYAKIPYDPLKDLAPITQVTSYQYVMVTLATSPITSVDKLVSTAKAQPGALSYGSTGIGGGNHLAGAMLALTTQTQLTHVPYKGSAAALTDLLGGQLSFTFDTTVTAVPYIRNGKLRAFAVSGPKRSPVLPDVPTMKELGFKDFQVTQFQGLLAPAKTDPKIIARLRDEVVKILKKPDVVERLVTQGGNEIVGGTPEEFAKLLRTESAQYGKLIKDANIKPE
jgi:tripartite-type tricarboxylate transporter receptor subunit TctC